MELAVSCRETNSFRTGSKTGTKSFIAGATLETFFPPTHPPPARHVAPLRQGPCPHPFTLYQGASADTMPTGVSRAWRLTERGRRVCINDMLREYGQDGSFKTQADQQLPDEHGRSIGGILLLRQQTGSVTGLFHWTHQANGIVLTLSRTHVYMPITPTGSSARNTGSPLPSYAREGRPGMNL